MNEIKLIQKSILKTPMGEPFTARSISGNASYANVRQVLSRLTKAGKIIRATRGIYVRPKEVPYLGKVLPGSEVIVKAISQQTGEVIATHGAEALRRLHLSTHVPMQTIYYTTGTTRSIKIGKLEIMLKHISSSKLVKPGTMTCLVVSALWYLGKSQVNTNVIRKIKEQLGRKQFSELLKNTQHMPMWMVEAFTKFNRENQNGWSCPLKKAT